VFSFQDRRGRVEVAFTDRFGGMSGGPFAQLNLRVPEPSQAALVYSENEDTVAENMDILAYAMDRGGEATGEDAFEPPVGGSKVKRIVAMHQVHGADVTVVDDRPHPDPTSDGLVTTTAGVILAPRAADCVPVLIADPDRGVVGAAHAGRKGMVAGVVPQTIAMMHELGATDLVAWVGPHACGRCYEVPAEMRQAVADEIPQSWAETSWGTASVDLGAGIAAQLEAEGAEVIALGHCTIEDDRYYSYRRDGQDTGRQAGLIWVRP
jgi:YfiH family protein